MIILNRFFAFQGPRRADLSGRPWGLLFVLKPFDAGGSTRFGLLPRSFGFYVPWQINRRGGEKLECYQLQESFGWLPNDWRRWPEGPRLCAQAAVQRALDERPGMKVISERSFCDRRIDLASQPWQLLLEIEVAPA